MTDEYEDSKGQIELKILLRCGDIAELDKKLNDKQSPPSFDVRKAIEEQKTLYYEQLTNFFDDYEAVVLKNVLT